MVQKLQGGSAQRFIFGGGQQAQDGFEYATTVQFAGFPATRTPNQDIFAVVTVLPGNVLLICSDVKGKDIPCVYALVSFSNQSSLKL